MKRLAATGGLRLYRQLLRSSSAPGARKRYGSTQMANFEMGCGVICLSLSRLEVTGMKLKFMKYKSVKVQWSDGKTATVKPPRNGWLDYLISNYRHGDYMWGYEVEDAHPFHMTNVYPDQVMALAREELEQLKQNQK